MDLLRTYPFSAIITLIHINTGKHPNDRIFLDLERSKYFRYSSLMELYKTLPDTDNLACMLEPDEDGNIETAIKFTKNRQNFILEYELSLVGKEDTIDDILDKWDSFRELTDVYLDTGDVDIKNAEEVMKPIDISDQLKKKLIREGGTIELLTEVSDASIEIAKKIQESKEKKVYTQIPEKENMLRTARIAIGNTSKFIETIRKHWTSESKVGVNVYTGSTSSKITSTAYCTRKIPDTEIYINISKQKNLSEDDLKYLFDSVLLFIQDNIDIEYRPSSRRISERGKIDRAQSILLNPSADDIDTELINNTDYSKLRLQRTSTEYKEEYPAESIIQEEALKLQDYDSDVPSDFAAQSLEDDDYEYD